MKILNVLFCITICLLSYACRSGSTVKKWCYFPNSAGPDDRWEAAMQVGISSVNKHFSEIEEKRCELIVYNQNQEVLFTEKFLLKVAIPEVEILWENYGSILITVKNQDGLVIFKKRLDWDSKTNTFRSSS